MLVFRIDTIREDKKNKRRVTTEEDKLDKDKSVGSIQLEGNNNKNRNHSIQLQIIRNNSGNNKNKLRSISVGL